MSAVMRALVFHGGEGMAVEYIPEPAYGPGDALVRVLAVGICGSDVHGFAGETGRRAPGMVMGHEISGVVDAVGADVPDWAVGDQVVVNPVIGCRRCAACAAGLTNRCARRRVIGVAPDIVGAFAERIAVPASNLVRFEPVGTATARDGSLVEPLAVALNAVRQAGVRRGESVAVIGLGMIGLACVWAALREGAAVVYAGDVDASRVQLSERLGSPSAPVLGLDLRSGSLHEQLAAHGRPPVDRVVDAAGLSVTLADALRSVAPGGVVGVVGMGAPQVELDMYEITTNEKSLVGSFCYSEPTFAECAAAVAAGGVDSSLFVDAVVSMEDAPQAFVDLATKASTSVKTILLPQS